MMNELKQTLDKVNNLQRTENGALGYATSSNELVDLNFRVPSDHNNVQEQDYMSFNLAVKNNSIDAVKWLFFLRDVREGLGERDSFIKLFVQLYTQNKDIALKVLHLIPEYGRWKDIIDILKYVADGTQLSDEIYRLIFNQIKEDCLNIQNGKTISLLGKWMPSINASQKSRELAKKFCGRFNLSASEYRKLIAKLRKYLDVTEIKTCGNNWGYIDYNKVSSNANARYVNSFMKHDQLRRTKYLESLRNASKTGAVMHASNLYPHEVYAKYTQNEHIWFWDNSENYIFKEDEGIEALWKNLKNIETVGNTMVIVDGSGSMCSCIKDSSIRAIDVSRSLGVFFSERCTGEFKNKVIEFSATPRYIDMSNCQSLAAKASVLFNYHSCSNTDLEKVFALILKTAVDNNLPQSELPERLLIVSDMEFDEATTYSFNRNYERVCHDRIMYMYNTLFDSLKNMWAEYGYKLPNIVFWNVNSRTSTVPVQSNECGITLVSGYSVNNIKMILSGDVNPWNALKSVLDSERYKPIEDAIRGID